MDIACNINSAGTSACVWPDYEGDGINLLSRRTNCHNVLHKLRHNSAKNYSRNIVDDSCKTPPRNWTKLVRHSYGVEFYPMMKLISLGVVIVRGLFGELVISRPRISNHLEFSFTPVTRFIWIQQTLSYLIRVVE